MNEGAHDDAMHAPGGWAEAYRTLSASPLERLGAGDLHRLGMAAFLTGRDAESDRALARAHQAWMDAGDVRRAAREAFWIGLIHVDRHEMSQAGGWFARGSRLLDGHAECAETGLFAIPAALTAMMSGDPETGLTLFRRAAVVGDAFDDPDLCALARLGEGQCLVSIGRTEDGMRLLDEVMVTIVADDTAPVVSGLVFCAVIETCQKVLDLRRASEWTVALSDWCDDRPDMQSHRGRCRVHRAEVARYRGDWALAAAELEAALVALADVRRPALAAAHYELGELHRLRGSLDEAEAAFARARRDGHDISPGFALLRMQQGRAEDAWNALPSAVELDGTDPGAMASVLAATIEIGLATGHRAEAAEALRRLREVTTTTGTAYLGALTDFCEGRMLLDAHEDAAAACGPLRRAVTAWQQLDAPVEESRARVAFGRARAAMGDRDTAAVEFDAARRVFTRLRALPDLDALAAVADGSSTGPLTERELEVLAYAARGLTNRQIAEELNLSQHTIRRHLQNTFTKLGVSSRAAAASWAHRNGLLP